MQPLLEKNLMELKNSDEVRTRSLVALEEAINIVGNSNRLAKALGISSPIIKQWKTSGKYGVNAKYVLPIEKLTDGQVKRYELRCDLYPESDAYFFMIKKFVYDVCRRYELTNETHLRSNFEGVNDDVGIFMDEFLSSTQHIEEIMRHTNYRNQFKLQLLGSDEWGSVSALMQHAYYAFHADICAALYENLQGKYFENSSR